MKVALVGIGKIAIDQHAPAITNSSEWKLSATVSRRGKLPGIPRYRRTAATVQKVKVCTGISALYVLLMKPGIAT